MKKLLVCSVALLAIASGCSNSKKASSKGQGGLTDVAPPAPMHQPVASTPIAAAYPATYEPAPAEIPMTSTPVAGGGRSYTVQKGDTLWSIAQRTYGEGKQYRKIVSANPNIKGERVLVGQTIVLP